MEERSSEICKWDLKTEQITALDFYSVTLHKKTVSSNVEAVEIKYLSRKEQLMDFLSQINYIQIHLLWDNGMLTCHLYNIHYLPHAIPVEESITPKNKISTYDEVRKLIYDSGEKKSVVECI